MLCQMYMLLGGAIPITVNRGDDGTKVDKIMTVCAILCNMYPGIVLGKWNMKRCNPVMMQCVFHGDATLSRLLVALYCFVYESGDMHRCSNGKIIGEE